MQCGGCAHGCVCVCVVCVWCVCGVCVKLIHTKLYEVRLLVA